MRTIRAALLLIGVLTCRPARPSACPQALSICATSMPSIAQDMRYAGSDNFTGRPLPGYGAAECVLRRAVAQALAQVQADLARENLGLKVYDCYRPTRAVRALMRWRWATKPARAIAQPSAFSRRWRSATLFAPGYIAAHSAHSTGSAVDLTLVQLPAPPAPPFDPRRALTAPAPRRPRSARPTAASTWAPASTASTPAATPPARAITPEQKRWRAMLVAAMRARGFHNYFREWWHFSFGPRAGQAYDFPIAPRP